MEVQRFADDVTHIPLAQIEDLGNAVHGAGLEVTQLSSAPVTGSLVFGQSAGVMYSSGLLNGRVGLRGSLSQEHVTFGLGVHIAPGSRHWISQEVESGSVGVWRPGDEHEALYGEGSLYVAATLSLDRLEQKAARMGLVLDARTLPGTGFDTQLIERRIVRRIGGLLNTMHAGMPVDQVLVSTMESELMTAFITHLARKPRPVFGIPDPKGHAAVVRRAQTFIFANLSNAMSADDIAEAAGTSRSTLFRSFVDILGEPPNSYVRKLRLHRIRNDLASECERAATVAIAGNCWGISELGRLAAWYKEHFGELPSETLARNRSAPALEDHE